MKRCWAVPNFRYFGRSLVVDPHGVVIADASYREVTLVRELDPGIVRSWLAEFLVLVDRRLRDV